MWISLQSQTWINKSGAAVIAALAMATFAHAGDGSGLGNNATIQRNSPPNVVQSDGSGLGNNFSLDGDQSPNRTHVDGSGLGNGGSGLGNSNNGPIFNLRPGDESISAVFYKALVTTKVRCTLKFDPTLKIISTDHGYEIRKTLKSAPRTIYEEKSIEEALTRLASISNLSVQCTKASARYSQPEPILKSILKEGLANNGKNLSSADGTIENGSIFLAFASATSGNQTLYQALDQNSSRSADALFLNLITTPAGENLDIELSHENSSIYGARRKVITEKIQLVAKLIDLVPQLASDQMNTYLALSSAELLFFNWKNPDLIAIESKRGGFTVRVMTEGPEDHDSGQFINIGMSMGPAARDALGKLNDWLAEVQAADLLLSISDRPTTVSYLSNLQHDLNVLTQFRQRVLDPVYMIAVRNQSAPLILQVYNSLATTFRARLAASLKAKLLISAPIDRRKIYQIDSRLGEETTKAPVDYRYEDVNIWARVRSCGDFSCPSIESDSDRLDGLWESFVNTRATLLAKYPLEGTKQEIPPYSAEGCKYVVRMIQTLAEFHNDFLIHAREVELGLDPRYANHPYFKKIFGFLEKLNQFNYKENKTDEFLTDTLPHWQTLCTQELPSIEAELKSFKAKPSSEIDREIKRFKKKG